MLTTNNHLAIYNNKVVVMDYLTSIAKLPNKARLKKEFHYAAMRILDNGYDGYVVTPNGEVFQILQSKRTAIRIHSPEAQDILSRFEISVGASTG